MSWITDTLTSSIGKKVLMSLTGLFLILFLTVHLAGNLQLLLSDGGEAFNIYSHNMAHNPLIRVVSYGNFAFIFLHVVVAITLKLKNKKARPIGYASVAKVKNATWSSKSMTLLGTLTLLFLIVHLRGFWYKFKFGSVPSIDIDGVTMHNSFAVVQEAYTSIIYSGIYVICMVVLSFHLLHGFSSAFQTLGLNHKKYTPAIKGIGKLYAILVPALFALIPIMLYLKSIA